MICLCVVYESMGGGRPSCKPMQPPSSCTIHPHKTAKPILEICTFTYNLLFSTGTVVDWQGIHKRLWLCAASHANPRQLSQITRMRGLSRALVGFVAAVVAFRGIPGGPDMPDRTFGSCAQDAMDLQIIVKEAVLYRKLNPLYKVRVVAACREISCRYATL